MSEEIMEKLRAHFETVIVVMSILAGLFFLDARDQSRTSSLEMKMDRQSERMDRQSERTDKLYEMFIHLLKERR